MNLGQIRAEVLARGFDTNQYGARVNQWINDALSLIARRVDYYVDEATSLFSTTAGTSLYPWPADFARLRSLLDTSRNVEMRYVSLRDIDQSAISTGAPAAYALSGQNVVLWPTPDNIYPMQMRYWKLPAPLVVDSDTPNIPADWNHLLWVYATWMAFESDDDDQNGQYWQQRFSQELAMFAADAKFPASDGPLRARSMWDHDAGLLPSSSVWTIYSGGG